MRVRSLLSGFLLFLVSATLAVSCANPAAQPPASSSAANSEVSVRLGFSAWPGWFPWQVSHDQQLFQANKAKVDLKWFDGYLESIQALTAGQLDANAQTLNDTVNSVANGSDQVIVLVNDNSTGNDKILVREGIDSIADLKGKKVAAESGTVDHFPVAAGPQTSRVNAERYSVSRLRD